MKTFPNGARVCFVGDSITHIGMTLKHIVAYYRTHFPDLHVEFYNCGIGGSTLENVLRVYTEDVEIHHPTHVVLMIGVNDSRHALLSEAPSDMRYQKLLAAYEQYQKNLETFYALMRERGIELTLCTPVPYAEYQSGDSPRLCGGYALVQGYANSVRAFAKEKEIALCDYHAAITRAMQTETLYDSDRVHPNERGHFWMASTFLAFQGIDYPQPEAASAEVEQWSVISKKLRDTIGAEYAFVPNYFALDDDARMRAIRALLKAVETKKVDLNAYQQRLLHRYVENKPHQKEYLEFVRAFMKGSHI
ncbi:MAG: SGNH/GDSL hydrolase family protein [Clostridia bacterium]|nr:SGNH/GDSL hydrolase family protein [Clostridia bacterium]